ncbi:MAG: tRNA uridine(34) 5-carboxymethylaminomethyl modification radical SAM/GNAT enzyme Elp3 [Chloroflexi bacterium]|jgi:elongator complex protein 3|nr:tRNA uridine(34) 5-carboxymethylaminomethyl modification radical SAM/GNAT enzyme Elp3 [Chloroflexota bacterium]MBT3668983.1 tRNA uridine(34) 5-carboxymethylaminomethyl modification radical SAM/GNAT enzyme Elp3 [Chloroflexota bacterium]MBT4002831.1 tRNA uridine(34) 5-carboxymethylaminomethyl modification radical SAM/GNAT enzyme Elp3 [Chloroflexota bacterium]MBT4533283.1 tRNA uridine(34) 5-carboxymethylaminomethyl modification radical SAM/GNAT enzyme Elp3 [Chloroflexota bacterium]MBT4683661.1 
MKKDLQAQSKEWFDLKKLTPDKMALAKLALADIREGVEVFDAIKRYPLQTKGGGYIGKQMLVAAYRKMVAEGEMEADLNLLAQIRMKPMRTQSGVTVVTVLTKPYPCPGKCIFCPTDIRMPKSYLPDEPGAMRALHHQFDPYDQVVARIQALEAVGHPTDKIELLILGGTWSSYRKDYQEWFILRLFDAMNEVKFESLEEAQEYNETAEHRNVGMVIETRPDHVTPKELDWLRYLGVTKVQMGAQSFDDEILDLNKRGHSTAETLEAVHLLRAGGFKIVLHWMPNLHGATPESDREDFARTWVGYCPDELKIYPNQLLENAELYEYWQRGEFKPYTTEELVELLVDIKPTVPRYCRINRVIRDIPSTNVVEGNKRTSLRMDIHKLLAERGEKCSCVRCREVRGAEVVGEDLVFDDLVYETGKAEEHFLSFVTGEDKIAGFLRLSLPGESSPETGLSDLDDSAIVREVHVYGQSIEVGREKGGAAQHIGLGTALLEKAEEIAGMKGFGKLAVIAAVGTRKYYGGRGFELGERYMVKNL